MFSKNILYYGKDEPLPDGVNLHAGPLSLRLEESDLRSIRLGDREVLSRIYVAIRDEHWGTVQPKLSDLQITSDSRSFHITFDVENMDRDIDFFWKGEIFGDAAGTIRYTLDGVARSTFMRSRIGFCILYPSAECAGLPCRVEKTDGRIVEEVFPRSITNVQPFIDNMRAISHQIVEGTRAEVRFEGETFEIEDQRNWTDASYKIFGTPLKLPRPVRIIEGTRIRQSVTLTLHGATPTLRVETSAQNPKVTLEPPAGGRFPRLGLGMASHGQPLDAGELARLKAIGLSHLRVDLNLSDPAYGSVLRQAAAQASALSVPLECAMILSDNYSDELKVFASEIRQVSPSVWAWLILQQVGWLSNGVTYQILRGTDEALNLAREYLQPLVPNAVFAGGTFYDFNELNALPPNRSLIDIVSYSITPQRHTFDNDSLVETLAIQAETVRTARAICGNLPISISPITLRPRPSPISPLPPLDPEPDRLPAYVDPRQMSLFGAGWTVGSLKYLADSSVESITYYETTGWCGVMESSSGTPHRNGFRSIPGSVFPVYHVLADLGEFSGGEIIPTKSSVPLNVQAVAVHKRERTRVLITNLGGHPQKVTLHEDAKSVWVRFLDERNVEEAMDSPELWRAEPGEERHTESSALELELLPYAIVRVDKIQRKNA